MRMMEGLATMYPHLFLVMIQTRGKEYGLPTTVSVHLSKSSANKKLFKLNIKRIVDWITTGHKPEIKYTIVKISTATRAEDDAVAIAKTTMHSQYKEELQNGK